MKLSPMTFSSRAKQMIAKVSMAAALATTALVSGCAVYPVGPGGPVVVGPAPVFAPRPWGYGYGHGYRPAYGHRPAYGYGHRYW
ncbi:MAG: hypothetical protein ABIU95_12315 [Burkholderiales bacterium]